MYSASPLLLSTSATLLSGDRVFVGNQPDDFAAGSMAGPAEEVCVLGLGYGGSLRPVLAVSPRSRVTAVDLDADMATVTGALFRQHFPGVGFRTVVADAAAFLDGSRSFDLVLVDVYAGESYPGFLLTGEFWDRVREAVAPGGTVLVNAWGLPSHLRPLTPPSPQAALADLLAPRWNHARYLSCRRNMTVVLRDSWDGVPAEAARAEDLNPLDAACYAVQRCRLARAEDFSVTPDTGQDHAGRDVPTTPEQLDAEMAARWPAMLEEVRKHAEAAGADASAVGTRDFYYRRDVAVPTTLELVRQGHPAAALLPNVAAGLTFAGDDSLAWFGEWIADDAETLFAAHPEWFVRTALPQALALAASPLVPRRPWEDRLVKSANAVAAAL